MEGLGEGPSEQKFFDVNVFSQLVTIVVERRNSAALTRELSTFANVREGIC